MQPLALNRNRRLRPVCGRYAITLPPDAIQNLFGTLNPVPNFPPRFNAAPTDNLPVVRFDPARRIRSLDLLRWGLVPRWAPDLSAGAKAINCRSETAAQKPSFRDAYVRRRCLVPVTAFYEWRRDGTARTPFAIGPADGGTMALAGLWDGWRDPVSGAVTRTFTILTTTAARALAPLHDRMPVILVPQDWPLWLGETDQADPVALAALLRPFADDGLRLWPVSARVNSVRNDTADLLEPIAA
jgi:putative SOS response-associated peptidase YedK